MKQKDTTKGQKKKSQTKWFTRWQTKSTDQHKWHQKRVTCLSVSKGQAKAKRKRSLSNHQCQVPEIQKDDTKLQLSDHHQEKCILTKISMRPSPMKMKHHKLGNQVEWPYFPSTEKQFLKRTKKRIDIINKQLQDLYTLNNESKSIRHYKLTLP